MPKKDDLAILVKINIQIPTIIIFQNNKKNRTLIVLYTSEKLVIILSIILFRACRIKAEPLSGRPFSHFEHD